MTFWDKAKRALEDAASSMNREAKNLGTHYELGQLEEKRDRELLEIGKRALELFRQRKISDPEIKVLAERIRELDEQIDLKREEIKQREMEESSD